MSRVSKHTYRVREHSCNKTFLDVHLKVVLSRRHQECNVTQPGIHGTWARSEKATKTMARLAPEHLRDFYRRRLLQSGWKGWTTSHPRVLALQPSSPVETVYRLQGVFCAGQIHQSWARMRASAQKPLAVIRSTRKSSKAPTF